MNKHSWIAPALAVLTLSGLVAAGCSSLKSKIAGSWKIDAATLKAPILEQAEQNPQVAEQIKKGIESGRFNFKADGTLEMMSTLGGATRGGKWTLEGNNLKLTIDGSKPEDQPSATVDSDGGRIHLSQGAGDRSMKMDLVKAP